MSKTMSALENFLISPAEQLVLQCLLREPVARMRAVGISRQGAVEESGLFCQAIFLDLSGISVAVLPMCIDLQDVELFRLRITTDSEVERVEKLNSLGFEEIPGAKGSLTGVRRFASNANFERTEGSTLEVLVERGILLQVADLEVLIVASPMPYFLQCYTSPEDIRQRINTLIEL